MGLGEQSSTCGASTLFVRMAYAASGTDRARLSACESRANMQRSAWSATRSIPRTRSRFSEVAHEWPKIGHDRKPEVVATKIPHDFQGLCMRSAS